MVIAVSFAFAWLRLRSGSLWPAALLHASHNLFIMHVFDAMTVKTGLTAFITGELGIGLALTGSVVAYLFWRRRGKIHSSL
jgi:membrane protease YdiL (CAAX protease family)